MVILFKDIWLRVAKYKGDGSTEMNTKKKKNRPGL